MSDAGDTSAARLGFFVAGSLLGAAVAGGGALALAQLARQPLGATRDPQRDPQRDFASPPQQSHRGAGAPGRAHRRREDSVDGSAPRHRRGDRDRDRDRDRAHGHHGHHGHHHHHRAPPPSDPPGSHAAAIQRGASLPLPPRSPFQTSTLDADAGGDPTKPRPGNSDSDSDSDSDDDPRGGRTSADYDSVGRPAGPGYDSTGMAPTSASKRAAAAAALHRRRASLEDGGLAMAALGGGLGVLSPAGKGGGEKGGGGGSSTMGPPPGSTPGSRPATPSRNTLVNRPPRSPAGSARKPRELKVVHGGGGVGKMHLMNSGAASSSSPIATIRGGMMTPGSHGGSGVALRAMMRDGGGDSEFTEASEFENDGDHLMADVRVVTTPKGGRARGKERERGDGGGAALFGGGANDDAGASERAAAAATSTREKTPPPPGRPASRLGRDSLDGGSAGATLKTPGSGVLAPPDSEGGSGVSGVSALDVSAASASSARVLAFVGVDAPPTAPTPDERGNPARLRGDATLGIDPGSAAAAARSKNADGTDAAATAGPPGGPADRAVARALKESFGSVSLRGGAGGSDDVEAAAARVHVDVGRALDRADDPAADDPAAADSDDSGYSGDDLGAYDGPAALRAGPPGDGGGGGGPRGGVGDANGSREAAPRAHEYGRVLAPDDELTSECEEVCLMLEHCLELRERYLYVSAIEKNPGAFDEKDPEDARSVKTGKVDVAPDDELPGASAHAFEMVAGVMHVYATGRRDEDEDRFAPEGNGSPPSSDDASDGSAAGPSGGSRLLFAPPASATEFFHDMHAVLRVHSYGPSKSFCHKRLHLTEQKFSLHVMLNADREFLQQKEAPHRDFYNVRKVDTHVHHSACMNQKHLLRFIKSKLKKEGHEQVIYRDGKFLNLREVFESINLSGYDLNVDTLDMHADKSTFHRFDRFNLKYNPCGQSRLREVFIKQDNLIRGRFLAEVTKEVISDLDANKYQMAEYRISIYGRRLAEWDTLASWVLNHRVFSENVVWLIQIPRLYNVYRSQGTMQNFQQMLDNIFQPLFEVTVDPSSHPALHHFLKLVVGFDMVDDESKPERRPSKHMRAPEEWDVPHNPAFAYYAYYVYANLYTLNRLREAKGMHAFTFRPHAGEAGDVDHLAAAFLLTKNIAHGINLRKSPVLQYLYYLAQIGLNMSPLSNNSLFLDYRRNPFPEYFARGLVVTLSTDDPLQIHMTKEPLVEEYSVAAQVWKMSAADLCEIARNSVLNSDFPHADKRHWVSDTYWKPGPEGNEIKKTNVPDIRLQFRKDVLEAEKAVVRAGVMQAAAKGRALHVS